METQRSSFKPSSSTFLSISTIVIGGQVLSASRLFLVFPPRPFAPPIHPDPLCHLHFSMPSFSSSLSQVHKPSSLQRDPRACAVGSGSTHAEHPLTNQLPPAPTSALPAGCWLPCPHPMPLCIFGPDAGQPAWNAPSPSFPAYLNPPNSSKTSSRRSPLCAAS